MKNDEVIIKVGLLFYISSIIGFIYEYLLNLVLNGRSVSHGILYGPWLPIYGTGSVLISFLEKFKSKPLKIFIISFLLTGTLELICGYILLNFLHKRLWDYTGWFLNINGFVCLLSATCFGIGGILIIYLLLPFIKKIMNKIDKKSLKILLAATSFLFIIDVIYTINNH